ncbi:contactin-associated protein 1-like [Ciona intestinalis]
MKFCVTTLVISLQICSCIIWTVGGQDNRCQGYTINNYYGITRPDGLNTSYTQAQGQTGPKGDRGVPGPRGPRGPRYDLLSRLPELKNLLTPKTCSYLTGIPGFNPQNGDYLIHPSPTKVLPLSANCNFSGIATTIIGHDALNEEKVSSCNPKKCYRRSVHYEATIEQITALINASLHCRQFIKYRCIASYMLHASWGPSSSWTSRSGNEIGYWGGAQRVGYCACGESGTCVDPTFNCNCDRNTVVETSDEGYITDKELLPVIGMAFGDVGDSGEHGWHTLGPLECWGRN